MEWDSLIRWIGIAGAVGTAAMGLVEACKAISMGSLSLATVGLRKVKRHLGKHALEALKRLYGPDADSIVLEGAWRKGPEELERTLRDGLRMAIFGDLKDLAEFLRSFGEPEPDVLAAAIKLLRSGDATDPAAVTHARARLARFESVVDVRVRAAVAAGRDAYVSTMQAISSVVAVSVSLAACTAGLLPSRGGRDYFVAFAIGLIAVPIAPVAKDFVTFLNSMRDAFSRKKAAAP